MALLLGSGEAVFGGRNVAGLVGAAEGKFELGVDVTTEDEITELAGPVLLVLTTMGGGGGKLLAPKTPLRITEAP